MNFEKNGYAVLPNFCGTDDVEKIRRDLDLREILWKDKRGHHEPGHSTSMVSEIPTSSLYLQDAVSDFVTKQRGVTQRVWNTKANLKKRWHGACEYYHTDRSYWEIIGSTTSVSTTAILFLNDFNEKNGCLWVFQGSHRIEYIPHEEFLNINSLRKNLVPTSFLDEIEKEYPPIPITGTRGTLVAFDQNLIHGSGHNISPVDRCTIIYQLNENGGRVKPTTTLTEKRYNFEKSELLRRLKEIEI